MFLSPPVLFADIRISVLPPVGRVPETSQLGLRDVGVELDKGGFVVGGHSDDHERTSVPNVYAVGDVLKVSEQIYLVSGRPAFLYSFESIFFQY